MGGIGAVIGWVTNVIAIRLLFRPYKPITIPILKIELQGLIPKRQQDMAKALAVVVSTELITGSDVVLSLAREDIKKRIGDKIEAIVKDRILDKLPSLVPHVIQVTMADFIGKTLRQEVLGIFRNPGNLFTQEDLDDIKLEIERIVEEKVLSFSVFRLEQIVYHLANRELKHIEIFGAVLGFLIGILQGLITLLII